MLLLNIHWLQVTYCVKKSKCTGKNYYHMTTKLAPTMQVFKTPEACEDVEHTCGSIHIWGSLHYLTLEPMGALQGFMDRSSTSHSRPQWRDIWRHSTRRQTADCRKCFLWFCCCLSNWRHEITTVKHIIDRRRKQTGTDELRREESNRKGCFFLWVHTRGCKSVRWHWVRTHGCGGSFLLVRSMT